MKKTKRGFTIVELVIVIGVIAILSAVLIPTFVSLSGKANDAKVREEVANTYTAYLIDKETSARKQGEVAIQDKEEPAQYWTYTQAKGWEKGSSLPTGYDTTADFTDPSSGYKVYEAPAA